MVFHCKKHCVQNDAECDEQVEQWVTHHLVQSTLKPQPAIIVHTTLCTFVTIPVWQVIW